MGPETLALETSLTSTFGRTMISVALESHVQREESIECSPKQVESVVVERVTYCAEPDQHTASGAGDRLVV